MPTIEDRFVMRRGLSANLVIVNEVPLQGEWILSLDAPDDAHRLKIGDGTTHYNDLPFIGLGGTAYTAGAGINIAGSVISSTLGSIALSGFPDSYADLPSSLGTGDAGNAYMLKSDHLVYIWDGTAFPADGDGIEVSGGGSIVVSDYVDTVLADAPIAFWKLDDAAGGVAADLSGNGRPGVYKGNSDRNIVPSINLPGAALFDGTTGYVDVAYGSWMDHGDISLEAWVYYLSGASSRVGLITRKYASSGWIPYSLETAAGPGSSIQMAQYTGSAWQNASAQNANPTMSWMHVVGTRSAAGILNIYVNGMKAAVPVTASVASPGSEGIFLGRQHNYVAASAYLSGLLSCCAVYDKVLTPAQVAKHYNVGSVPRWLIGD